jgi:tRNA-Thr(GGU) m(6)t(6)A37 methyltransferase TsaA
LAFDLDLSPVQPEQARKAASRARIGISCQSVDVSGTATYEVTPIGRVESSRDEAVDDDWESVTSTIVMDAERFTADSLAGLDAFSHVEIVFLFDRVEESEVQLGARHPRGNPGWPKVGIFAQRAKMRPNRIGVSVCRVLEVDGPRVRVEALDAIDGTPVLDIKPVMTEFLPRGEIRQPAWSHELMATYWNGSCGS